MDAPLADELVRIARGEILHDNWSRKIYSVDASHYTITPTAITCPVDEYDVEKICHYAFSKNIPVAARGAGTGLLGQSLSSSILIDFTRHMNKIIEIGTDYAIVQPGIVKGILDKELKKKGKFLPPDPASSNYCTIGGMIANNSSGVHCLGYGNTIEYLQEIYVVYSDGSSGFLSTITDSNKIDDHNNKMLALFNLLSSHSKMIQKGYPKVTKNSCGYRLDTVLNSQGFYPQKLFAASEGTLGIITSAKVKILDIPLYRYLMVLGFKDVLSATFNVPLILRFLPVALEMLDHTLFDPRQTTKQVSDNIGCLLFVEFVGNSVSKLESKAKECRDSLSYECKVLEAASDEKSILQIWEARKSALNDVLKLTVGSRRPIGLIEDTVVTPDLLYHYTQYLLQMYIENKLDYVMYGHVGNGNLHTRPLINMDSHSEIELMDRLAYKTFKRVVNAGGTITGEHGDGLARVKFIKLVYGDHIFSLFVQIKKLFDPKFIMNPGKKIVLNNY